MPRIKDFCICIYVFGCKLSLSRLCDSDFGIIPVDDRDHLCCILFPHNTYLIRQFLVFFSFVGYCFGEIMCIRDGYVYQQGFLRFFPVKVMSGPLEVTDLSVIIYGSTTAWNCHSPVNWLVCTYSMDFCLQSSQLLLPLFDG